ncbi:hypothetical protein LTR17_002393 [Elasticomyces elasticus]|nr:hypothetical protein LTR17_002393 [Elasticomyces elasticus]
MIHYLLALLYEWWYKQFSTPKSTIPPTTSSDAPASTRALFVAQDPTTTRAFKRNQRKYSRKKERKAEQAAHRDHFDALDDVSTKCVASACAASRSLASSKFSSGRRRSLLLELPRELRDIIYALVIDANLEDSANVHYAVRIFHRPGLKKQTTQVNGTPKLIGVSHQVAREFVEALGRSTAPYHLYYAIMPGIETPRTELVRAFFNRTKQSSRLFVSVGLPNAAGDKHCLGPLGLNDMSFRQLRHDVQRCTNVKDIVVEWLSPLHGTTIEFCSDRSDIHHRQRDLDRLIGAVRGLPKLCRYLLVVHEHATYGSKLDNGEWKTSYFKVEAERTRVNRFRHMNDVTNNFLTDMVVRHDKFPPHQDRGGVVKVNEMNFWGFDRGMHAGFIGGSQAGAHGGLYR